MVYETGKMYSEILAILLCSWKLETLFQNIEDCSFNPL